MPCCRRYDLDSSGLIDSREEATGLCSNTSFKVLSPKVQVSFSDSDRLRVSGEALCLELQNGHAGYNKSEWCQWFETEIYLRYEEKLEEQDLELEI